MPTKRAAGMIAPNEGEMFDVVGDRYRFLATTDMTNGRYAVIEAFVPPGGGPPPHVHSREEEGFYIIEGEMTFRAEDRAIRLSAGGFINLPIGVMHSFRNETDRPVKMLIIVAPGGIEAMFRQAGRAANDPTSPIAPFEDSDKGKLVAAAAEHGIEIKLPPA